MRKLASVQRVVSVEPIENADRIEKLKVLGWTLVSGKGNFKPNDLCVYLEEIERDLKSLKENYEMAILHGAN